MERDFFGISSSKDSGPTRKDEAMPGRQDTGPEGFLGPAVQWPFLNKVTNGQQYMPYKAVQQERPKKYVFDQSASSGFESILTVESFDTDLKTSPASAPQKYISQDRHHQFPMHAYRSQSIEAFGGSIRQLSEARAYPVIAHNSVPVATSSSDFKFRSAHGASNVTFSSLRQQPFGGVAANTPIVGSVIGTLAPPNMLKPTPTSAQMTIFYAGTVTVYDDVQFDKAHTIMLLASKGSNASSNARKGSNANSNNSRVEAPLPITAPVAVKVAPSDGFNMKQIDGVNGFNTKQTENFNMKHTIIPAPVRVASPCSRLSSPISVSSHTVANSRNTPSTTDDTTGAKAVSSLATTCQQEPPKSVAPPSASATATTIMPRAVPQARKASLARFIEKRKERVTSALPYSCTKKTPETSATSEMANPSNMFSTVDLNLPVNREDTWCIGLPKSSIVSQGSPSTRLEI